MLHTKRRRRKTNRRRIAALSLLVITFMVFSAIQSVSQPASKPTQPSGSNPQATFNPSPPDSFSGQGLNINSTMSFNGWNSTNLKANNTLTSYQQRNALTFSTPIPTGYSKIWQNVTISNLTATQDVREVQYATGSSNRLIVNDTGAGTYTKVAMRFRSIDKANLTGIWIYYGSALAASLKIVNASTNADLTPGSYPTIATYTLPAAIKGWNLVKPGNAVTLRAGFYYWAVIDATGSGGAAVDWYYVPDPSGVEDGKCAAIYFGTWLNETDFRSWYGYLNLMLMLNVVPVDTTDVSKVRVYSSPLQLAMNETNSNTQLLGNTTRIPVGYSTFALRANTSVTFTANWTARFANQQTGKVATTYKALQGVTFWNATFTSDAKPSSGMPKTAYNRTITVSPISTFWRFDQDETKNITNTGNINFTADHPSNIMFITQTDDINKTDVWSADWTIRADSINYRVWASAPFDVIQWRTFNVSVTFAQGVANNLTILFYNQTDWVTYNRTYLVPGGTLACKYPVTLNSTGYYDLIVFDKHFDWVYGGNEASFFNFSWIRVLPPLTKMSLNATAVSATWGDTVHIKANFQNATGGVVSNFTSTPNFTVGSYVVPTPSTPWGNNGSYVLDYPSTLHGSAGSYVLWVNGTYTGGYANETSFILNLAKVPMNVTIVAWQDELLPGSSLNVTARLTYERNETAAPDGFGLRFNFTITYWSAPSGFVIRDEVTSQGNATASLLATSTMRMISVNVSYAGNPIMNGDYDVKSGIAVLETLTRMSLNATTVSATWGDTIHIKVNFQNVTGGMVKAFPSSPMPTFSVGSYVVPAPELTWGNNGSYLLNYPSSLIASAGSYDLAVNGSYPGGYANTTTLHLNLAKVQMSVTITACQDAVLPYSDLLVTANLAYEKNGTRAQDGFDLLFNFTITYRNASTGILLLNNATYNGVVTLGLLAMSDMQSISVDVSFAGDSIRGGAHDTRADINVPPLLTQLSLESAVMNATWSDQIHIRVMFQNATQGSVKDFPSSALPVFNVGGGPVSSVVNEGGGWYSFNYSTNMLTSAGNKQLTITATYQGIYVNNTATLYLGLKRLPMVTSMPPEQQPKSVTAGSPLTVRAEVRFLNGTLVPYSCDWRFDFVITYDNGSVVTHTTYKTTADGSATETLTTTANMKSINATANYLGDPRLDSAASGTISVPVTVPTGLPIILLVGSVAAGSVLVILPLVVRARRRKWKAKEARKESRLTEAASLAQLVVVHLASGRCVFSRSLGSEETVDPHLISGFLSANQAVLSEAFKGKAGAGLRSADYGEYKVVSHVGNYIMSTLFCTETAGTELRHVLEEFTEKFERRYADVLARWDGNIDAFVGAEDLAGEVFALPLCSPYMIAEEVASKAKLKGIEMRVLREATKLSAGRGVFFMPRIIDFLLTKEKVKRSKTVDVLGSLEKKGIFKQLTVDEAAEVVKRRGG